MNTWQKAVQKFIEPWKKRSDVIGALVCGSFVSGLATKNSDIDIHIILSNKVNWRERGNKIVDGYMIEYFANPIKQIKKYQQEIFTDMRRTDARMFSSGIILFDKTGELIKFQKFSKKRMFTSFKAQSKFSIELSKYFLWDEADNLKDLYEQHSPGFSLFYYHLLEITIKTYAKFLKLEIAPPSKLYRFLTDKNFCEKYKIEQFSDQVFVKHFLQALKKPDFKRVNQLVNYVLVQIGGLKVDGFKLKTKLAL